jgi:hypothetical protein
MAARKQVKWPQPKATPAPKATPPAKPAAKPKPTPTAPRAQRSAVRSSQPRPPEDEAAPIQRSAVRSSKPRPDTNAPADKVRTADPNAQPAPGAPVRVSTNMRAVAVRKEEPRPVVQRSAVRVTVPRKPRRRKTQTPE